MIIRPYRSSKVVQAWILEFYGTINIDTRQCDPGHGRVCPYR